MRDIQPVEAHPLGCGQQLGQRVRTEAEQLEVDQLVEEPYTLRRGFGLVQRGCARRLDAGADQADEEGWFGVQRHAVTFNASRYNNGLSTWTHSLQQACEAAPSGQCTTPAANDRRSAAADRRLSRVHSEAPDVRRVAASKCAST